MLEAASVEVSRAAKDTIDILNQAGIPVLITGGLAVVAYGYDAFTRDVDLIVPDVAAARQVLRDHGYQLSPLPFRVHAPVSGVHVDIMPGGKSLTPSCPVNFPMPTEMGQNYSSLVDLISTKLGSYVSDRRSRLKDLVAVTELIKAGAPRDLAVDPVVRELYLETWDGVANGLGELG